MQNLFVDIFFYISMLLAIVHLTLYFAFRSNESLMNKIDKLYKIISVVVLVIGTIIVIPIMSTSDMSLFMVAATSLIFFGILPYTNWHKKGQKKNREKQLHKRNEELNSNH